MISYGLEHHSSNERLGYSVLPLNYKLSVDHHQSLEIIIVIKLKRIAQRQRTKLICHFWIHVDVCFLN